MKNLLGSLVFFLLVQTAGAQRSADTSAVIREFNDVMEFTVHPYLHYTSTTSIRTDGMDRSTGSGGDQQGEFYKYGDDLYYGTGNGELFLQDSLMIRIDHQRKTVRVSKVDLATKRNLDITPLKKMAQQRLLRTRYTIGKLAANGDTAGIVIRSKPGFAMDSAANSELLVEYIRQAHLPTLLQVKISGREPNSDKVMTQTVSIRIGAMEITKEAAMRMPKWEDRLGYDPGSGSFNGKERCAGYEIVKTF